MSSNTPALHSDFAAVLWGRMWGLFVTTLSGGTHFGYGVGTISGILEMDDWIKTFGEPDRTAPTGFSVSTPRESLVVSILSAGILLDRLVDAGKALSRLSSLPEEDPRVQTEIDGIASVLQEERGLGEGSYADYLCWVRNKTVIRTLISMTLHALQQMAWINFVAYYGAVFCTRAGIKYPYMICAVANAMATAVTPFGIVAVGRFNRRSLLVWEAVVMCICQYLVVIVGIAVPVDNMAAQRALIALVCISVAAFVSTWGPVAWAVTNEITPLKVRAKSTSLSTASNWWVVSSRFSCRVPRSTYGSGDRLWNWALAFATPYLVNSAPGGRRPHGEEFLPLGVNVRDRHCVRLPLHPGDARLVLGGS
ncbi:hypothetical protein BD413DRAFT_494792 [Trametes elegans]|nr:hypothetical protein BD413DRAFT_494792 [Trametes elegans]